MVYVPILPLRPKTNREIDMNKARNRDWTSDIVRHRMRYITRDLDKYMRIMWRSEVQRFVGMVDEYNKFYPENKYILNHDTRDI